MNRSNKTTAEEVRYARSVRIAKQREREEALCRLGPDDDFESVLSLPVYYETIEDDMSYIDDLDDERIED